MRGSLKWMGSSSVLKTLRQTSVTGKAHKMPKAQRKKIRWQPIQAQGILGCQLKKFIVDLPWDHIYLANPSHCGSKLENFNQLQNKKYKLPMCRAIHRKPLSQFSNPIVLTPNTRLILQSNDPILSSSNKSCSMKELHISLSFLQVSNHRLLFVSGVYNATVENVIYI